MLKCTIYLIQGCSLAVQTEHLNVVSILCRDSKVNTLQQQALSTLQLCSQNNIRLPVQWVSRDQMDSHYSVRGVHIVVGFIGARTQPLWTGLPPILQHICYT